MSEWKDLTEKMFTDKRVKKGVTFSKSVLEALETVRSWLRTNDGKKYPFSWFLEDLVVYVLSDKERLNDFLRTMYDSKGEKENAEKEGEER